MNNEIKDLQKDMFIKTAVKMSLKDLDRRLRLVKGLIPMDSSANASSVLSNHQDSVVVGQKYSIDGASYAKKTD